MQIPGPAVLLRYCVALQIEQQWRSEVCSVSSCLLHVTAFWGGDVAQLHDPVPFLLALSMASR